MAQGYSQFLPIGPGYQPPRQTKPKVLQKQNDPEKSPERQLARRLGDYGADILRDKIKVEYAAQREKWLGHIGKVVAAYSIALGHQEDVLKKTEGERRAAAELQIFIFSLVTAGFMRWAGSFVQFKVFPKLYERPVTKYIYFTDQDWPQGVRRLIQTSEIDYNRQVAAFVGGILQDAGNLGGRRYLSQKLDGEAFAGMVNNDNASLVRITEQTLKKALEDATEVVMKDMDDAIFWLEQSPTFGERWASFANGNESLARSAILKHLQSVRDKWAKEWPFFGQNPKPFAQEVLAQSFERGLWAGWINGYLSQFSKGQGFTREKLFSKQLDRELINEHVGARSEFAVMIYDFVIGNAIIDRLKNLNVIKAETAKGAIAQLARQKDQMGPAPSVTVKDDIGVVNASETLDEIRALWDWSRNHPAEVSVMLQHSGAEGMPRPLIPFATF